MNNKKRIVIVGATSLIAEQCARLWLKEQPIELVLVGRDVHRLERIAKDFQVRSPQSDIQIVQSGFLDPKLINTTVESIVESGSVDILLIAHGSLPDQAQCEDSLEKCREALEINGISPVLYAEAFAKHMSKIDHGTIAVIGSVAGDRGRRSNYVYGAAKGLVARYAQGLQHRFAGTGVHVVLIKPGPTDTPMTANLKANGVKLASVELVARQIVDGIAKGKSVIYTPIQWRIIMLIIMHIPNFIFNKLKI